MREFMTKVSDYLDERRNDPDRQEDRLAIVIIGAVAVMVIVILLLILWRHAAGERAREENREELRAKRQMLETTEYEEETPEYMASGDEEDITGEDYLSSIEYLSRQVEELLSAMTQVEQNLSETIEQYQAQDNELREQIITIRAEVSTIVQNLKETQTKLYDLTDIVQIMDREKIPMIQEQILEIQGDMKQVQNDITNLYAKITALEQEDDKLWESIGALEETLQTVLNRNMAEVNNQFAALLGQLKTVENRIGKLAVQTLKYRYDAGENTLYLEPYEE
ncbi:MAG: hypothetical protein K2L82_04155 [Lachnospiraceae bacterium]|nr:hypothetical protein [Lachnospiraceae bacterium]